MVWDLRLGGTGLRFRTTFVVKQLMQLTRLFCNATDAERGVHQERVMQTSPQSRPFNSWYEITERDGFPLSGVRGFQTPSILGCYVTNFAPHLALKLIAQGVLTFDGRVALHRVDGRRK